MFRKLNGQFLFFVTPIFVISFTILSGVYAWLSYHHDEEKLKRHLQGMSASQSIILAESVAEQDDRLGLLLASVIGDRHVKGVAVYDADGEVLDFSGDLAREEDDLFSRTTINFSNGTKIRRVGELVILVSLDELKEESRLRLGFLMLLGGILLLSCVAGGMYSNHRGVIRPIVGLLNAIRSTGGELKRLPDDLSGSTEVRELIAAYNEMQSRLAAHEQDLRTSREQFREMFEESAVSIWHQDMSAVYDELERLRQEGVTDLRKHLQENRHVAWHLCAKVRVLQVNEATLLLFGARDETAFLNRIDTTFAADTINVFIDEVCAFWNKEPVFRAEATYRRFDGAEIDTITMFSVPRTREGFRSIAVSIIDHTEQKKTEARLRLNVQQAQATNQMLLEFLPRISHDVRNQLNAVLGFAQAMLHFPKTSLSDDQEKYVINILACEAYLRQSLSEISEFTLTTTDQMVLAICCINLNKVIGECVTATADVGMPHQVTVNILLDGSKPILVTADNYRLRQVLVTMLSNAKKQTAEGGTVSVSGTLVSSATAPDKDPVWCFRLSVKNDGDGIPQADQQDVFGEHKQIATETIVPGTGTGVGLKMVRLLAEQMECSVGFDSEHGRGSTFWIDIPLAPEGVRPLDEAELI